MEKSWNLKKPELSWKNHGILWNILTKPPVARKLAVRHTSFVCLTAIFWLLVVIFIISVCMHGLQVCLFKYRSTLLCQTCLSRIHVICRSDHPFPSISPILLCISNMFMSNLVITKSRLYQSGFSFPKIRFPLFYHYLCRSKFCVGQKIKQYECQTK